MDNASETGSPAPSESASSAQSPSDQPTKSWVWQHFKRLPDQERAACQVSGPSGRLCSSTFKYRGRDGTSGLARHLVNAHQLTAPGAPSESGRITGYFKPTTAQTDPLTRTTQTDPLTRESLKAAIVKLVARRALPYQIAEYSEFRDLLALCNPLARNMCVGADAIRTAVLTTFIEGKSYWI
jgi:BED zinc finger